MNENVNLEQSAVEDQTAAPEAPAPAPVDNEGTDTAQATPPQGNEGDTFPRAYVEELRKESAKYRERAAQAEKVGAERDKALFTALVKLDGRLADPAALTFDPALLDPAAIESKITEAIAANPRLAKTAVGGDIGQGQKGGAAFDLISFIRENS